MARQTTPARPRSARHLRPQYFIGGSRRGSRPGLQRHRRGNGRHRARWNQQAGHTFHAHWERKRLAVTPRTPITLVTGPLGSGKTTLLRHILRTRPAKIAIVMNEFGEMAIDTKVMEGKNVRIAELGGGGVCCSLVGEFEAAVNEIIEKISPEMIVVETTGLAEPEALVLIFRKRCRNAVSTVWFR